MPVRSTDATSNTPTQSRINLLEVTTVEYRAARELDVRTYLPESESTPGWALQNWQGDLPGVRSHARVLGRKPGSRGAWHFMHCGYTGGAHMSLGNIPRCGSQLT